MKIIIDTGTTSKKANNLAMQLVAGLCLSGSASEAISVIEFKDGSLNVIVDNDAEDWEVQTIQQALCGLAPLYGIGNYSVGM